MEDPIIEELERSRTFRVDAYCEGYPDVVFEIILDARPTPEQTATAFRVMERFVEGYNRRHFLRRIHYMSDMDDEPEGEHPRGIYIHIDFGICSPRALLEAVRALERSGLPIFRVALL